MIYYSKARGGFFDDAIHDVLPDDVVEISSEVHRQLLDSQCEGKVIVGDDQGYPQSVDPRSLLSPEQLMASLRTSRDSLLAACDWTQMPDSPLSETGRAEWADYRQALRDLPETVTNPATAEWPVAPA